MRIAIVGSRNLTVSMETLEKVLPWYTDEILSGGAKGIDSCAKQYAKEKNMKYLEYLPDYEKYGKSAPLYRNLLLIIDSPMVYAFWDGKSKGTKYVISHCKKMGIPCKVFLFIDDDYTEVTLQRQE